MKTKVATKKKLLFKETVKAGKTRRRSTGA